MREYTRVTYNNAEISEGDTECWENLRIRKQCVPGHKSQPFADVHVGGFMHMGILLQNSNSELSQSPAEQEWLMRTPPLLALAKERTSPAVGSDSSLNSLFSSIPLIGK